MLDYVYLQRNALYRPAGRGMGKTEVHRHEETVLDAQLLAHGEIEFLRDERLAEVDGELGIAHHFRQRPRAKALIRDAVAIGRAERKGRILVEGEVGAVV